MKVYISNYRNHWLSPYTIMDYAFFWTDWSKCSRDKSLSRSLNTETPYIEHPEWVEKCVFYLIPISKAIRWVLQYVYPRVNYVKIDKYDTWSMDNTLAYIILPMLKQLQETKHGAPYVDDEDVPEELRSTSAPPKEKEYDVDDNHFKRWDWVLNEMIFAFSCKIDDSWQDEFRKGEIDWKMVPVDEHGNEVPKGEHKYYKANKGPNDTYKCDYEGIEKVEKRIQNGFRLLGKYYSGLWD